MTFWTDTLPQIVAFLSDIVEIIVGTTALYVAWSQRERISAVVSILLGYSLRMSLADLRHTLEKLSENSTESPESQKSVRQSLAHIAGKIRGNTTLRDHLGGNLLKQIVVMLDNLDDGVAVRESSKTALCSEIKERILTLEIENHSIKHKK